jgi:predicted transcriptional regulator
MYQRGVNVYPVVFGVRLSADQADKVRSMAKADDRPTSVVLRRLISDALARENHAKGAPVT